MFFHSLSYFSESLLLWYCLIRSFFKLPWSEEGNVFWTEHLNFLDQIQLKWVIQLKQSWTRNLMNLWSITICHCQGENELLMADVCSRFNLFRTDNVEATEDGLLFQLRCKFYCILRQIFKDLFFFYCRSFFFSYMQLFFKLTITFVSGTQILLLLFHPFPVDM